MNGQSDISTVTLLLKYEDGSEINEIVNMEKLRMQVTPFFLNDPNGYYIRMAIERMLDVIKFREESIAS